MTDFNIGDWVRVTGSRLWGEVVSVGHMYITIRVDNRSSDSIKFHTKNLTYPRERIAANEG